MNTNEKKMRNIFLYHSLHYCGRISVSRMPVKIDNHTDTFTHLSEYFVIMAGNYFKLFVSDLFT